MTNFIAFDSGLKLLMLIVVGTASANDLYIGSCLHRYLPSSKTLGQAFRMSFSLHFLSQCGHDCVSLFLQVCKFAGLGGIKRAIAQSS